MKNGLFCLQKITSKSFKNRLSTKKISLCFLLHWLMLLNFHTYSQELQWQKKDELTISLHQSMKSFVDEEPYIRIELPSVFEVGLFDYFRDVLTRKRNEKEYTEQKRIRQQEIKNFLETHFIFHDTILEFVFFDRNQIIEWGKFGTLFVQSEEFNVNGCNIFILMVDGCSGVRCLSIYIFAQENDNWKLITGTSTYIRERIYLRIDNEQKKIIFETEAGKIGEFIPPS